MNIKQTKTSSYSNLMFLSTGHLYHQPTNLCPVRPADIHREDIVIKVTPQSADIKRAAWQKVQDDDLNSIQYRLHYAPVDDLHYSCSTMHRGLCSSRLDPVNEKTWNQAIGTLSKKKKQRSPAPSRMTLSPEAAHIQEGQVQACARITVWEEEGCGQLFAESFCT